MQFFVAKDRQPAGPFTEEQVRAMLRSGYVTAGDLGWHEGMPTWLPLSQIPAVAAEAPPSIFVPAPLAGRSLAHSGEHPGFWLRLAAHIVDHFITNIAVFVVAFVMSLAMAGVVDEVVVTVLGMLVGVVMGWLYYALMECSPTQATLGKMACGLVVTDLEGQRLSFGRATGRYFGMIVSALALCIGFLMCAWTERKQCLHDMMAGCLMFKK